MRSTRLLGAALLALVAACNKSAPSTIDAPRAGGDLPASFGTASQPAATIVYTTRGADPVISAVLEDGSKAPVKLSSVGATFAGALPGRRVLMANHAADKSIESLEVVGADGANRVLLGKLAAGKWATALHAKADGDAIVVELARAGAENITDVVALKAGAEPVVVAPDATIAGVASGRVAFVHGGDLASARLDGSSTVALGGGDGQDRVVEIRGDRAMVTLHGAGAGDVRIEKLDGSEKLDLGTPAVDDRGLAFLDATHVVLAKGHAIVSMSVDGSAVHALTPAGVEATFAAVTPAGDVLFTSAGALYVTQSSGAPRLLDADAGATVRVGKVVRDRVFYTGNGLRAAKLDGSGTASLCNEPTWIPFFAAVTPDERVVFYRALSGQLEGGKLFSVKIDGTDLRPVGEQVSNPDGAPYAGGVPEDQDFEGVTPQGRIVLEAEFEGVASHLMVSAGDAKARRIADLDQIKFAALLTE